MKLGYKFLILMMVGTFSLTGCETIKDMHGDTAPGISQGLEKDWQNIKKADQKIKEKLW